MTQTARENIPLEKLHSVVRTTDDIHPCGSITEGVGRDY